MRVKKKKESSASQVSEPVAQYGTLRIHHSFEDMNEADAKEMAHYTPEQHLQHATALIQRIYAGELKKKFTAGRIYFK